jgi:phosphopentomutase
LIFPAKWISLASIMRAFLVVLDSVGIGAAPDAHEYGDAGANTLANLAEAVKGVSLPVLERLGLGCIPPILPEGKPIAGVEAVAQPEASFGAMQEVSRGKDTTTGHWEMAGIELENGFHLFPPGPPSFPPELIQEFESRTGRPVIGNKAASGTVIIEELGEQHIEDGAWIAYTSADSVFQIAAHKEVIPLEELYGGCEIAREICDRYAVGRVIARPFVGRPGAFKRTEDRRDFSYPLPEPTILDKLKEAGIPVATIGKLDDIFAGCGIDKSYHVENNKDAIDIILRLAGDSSQGLFFANLIDFDMLYGHRRDPVGYAGALENTDRFLAQMLPLLGTDDLLILTADHGNDPTFKGTDHCREFVPLLVYRPGQPGRPLGIRKGFFDIAQSLSSFFGIERMARGKSFI